MKSGGTGESSPSTSQDIASQRTLAHLREGESAARIVSGLPESTMMLKGEGGSCARISLWGKDVRNNPKIEAAWAWFSQFVMTTLNTCDVEFMEASWSKGQGDARPDDLSSNNQVERPPDSAAPKGKQP